MGVSVFHRFTAIRCPHHPVHSFSAFQCGQMHVRSTLEHFITSKTNPLASIPAPPGPWPCTATNLHSASGFPSLNNFMWPEVIYYTV